MLNRRSNNKKLNYVCSLLLLFLNAYVTQQAWCYYKITCILSQSTTFCNHIINIYDTQNSQVLMDKARNMTRCLNL